MKGLDLEKLGRYEETIECYDRALKLDSRYAKVWYQKGLDSSKIKDYKDAVESYDKALEIDENYTFPGLVRLLPWQNL